MQETNLYTITIPPMKKTLQAFSHILDKAAAHSESKKLSWMDFESALLVDKIIFDQFNFTRQVQIASDNAKGIAARLAEIEIPVFEDNETTIVQLKERLEKTIAFLETIKPEQVIGKEAVKVTLSYFPGKHMTGFDYVTQYAMPNFYFHITTAYDILRKNGVNIGKGDYTGTLPFRDEEKA
ncbi:DUF1993 domain-containing protein [Candidatus Kaiserbacteria bacterium]|nr:DUF1993 domain-containing protein [Candidatus Kaiserbacteria bacterium]